MSYNLEYESYFENKHNTKYEALFNSKKSKYNPHQIDNTISESYNPFEEVESKKVSKEELENIDKLFGWDIQTFMK